MFRNNVMRSILGLVALALLASASVEVSAKTVSDPNHKGWTGKHPRSKQVQWKPVVTKCVNCKQITAQYNQTVQELLNHRYWVHFWREVHKNREKGNKDPFWPGKGDINEFEGKAVAANLELFENQRAQLALHKKAVRTLEPQIDYLAKAMNECERTQCPDDKPTKTKGIKIGGEPAGASAQPDIQGILKQYDIDWRGPYGTKCLPCKSLTDQLNALPGWVVRAHMQLQHAELMLKYAKLIEQSNKVKLEFLKYQHPDKTDYSHLAEQVTKLKQDLKALKQLFDKLLVQVGECEAKYCPPVKGPIGSISNCPLPDTPEMISVGANSDVGSSANFKQKAKKKAAGLATKAIGSLLGIGGGSGKSKGPATYKDPVKNKRKSKFKDKAEKRDIRVGGVFTEDGLLISTDIKKAPGKGTFQRVYLQNPRGWRLEPIRLLMYEIWAEWKLSVSWTRDTYIDGEHVKHERGGWSESWRELIARGQQVEYARVAERPIWEQLGFNTAVSGARSVGTIFPVSPEMLANEPLNLVVHVTDPKKDPVVTYPYLFEVSLGDKGKVEIERVEQSLAHAKGPCDDKLAAIGLIR